MKNYRNFMRVMSLVLSIALVFSVFSFGSAISVSATEEIKYWGGDGDTTFEGSGTENDPFKIYTPDEFFGMLYVKGQSNGAPAYFKLMNDIYVNDTSVENWTTAETTKNWYTGVGADAYAFSGYFDGGYHTVYGIYSKVTSQNYRMGLFPNITTGSVVKNVTVSDSYISANNYAGGITGGIVLGTDTTPAEISHCGVTESVTVDSKGCSGAGIVGMYTQSCSISNCYSLATLTGTYPGLIGDYWGSFNGTVTDSFIKGYKVIGKNVKVSYITVNNCYTDNATETAYVGSGVTVKSATDMQGANALKNMGLSTNHWVATENYPAFNTNYDPNYKVWTAGTLDTDFEGSGTETDPYRLYTGEELFGMLNICGKVNGNAAYFKLMNDVYLNDVKNQSIYDVINPGNWYSAIAKNANAFAGYFDGGFNTVYGLYAYTNVGSNDTRLALFPNITDNAVVKNIVLSDSYIESPAYVGGIVGGVTGGSTRIENCGVSADVTIKNASTAVGGAGAILGRFTSPCTINNCYSLATLLVANSGSYTGLTGDSWGQTNEFVVSNSYISGYEAIGKAHSNYTVINVYTNKTGATIRVGTGVTVLTDAEMQGENAVATMKLPTDFWGITETYPVLKGTNDGEIGSVWSGSVAGNYAGGSGALTDPYLIATGEQLRKMIAELGGGKYYMLTNDIYLNDTSADNWTDTANNWYSTTYNTEMFTGNVDGNGYTIYGLYSNANNYISGGFSGLIQNLNVGSKIENLHIRDSYISGTWVGAFAGSICGTDGSEEGSVTITGCSVDDSVTVDGTWISGFFGVANAGMVMENCYTTAKCISYTSHASGYMVGGAYGNVWTAPTHTIVNFYSKNAYPFAIGQTNNSVAADETTSTYSNIYNFSDVAGGSSFVTDVTAYSEMTGLDTVNWYNVNGKAWLLKNRGVVLMDISGDDDGNLTSDDLTILRKILLGIGGYENAVSNINGDNETNILDLIRLKKAVAGITKN